MAARLRSELGQPVEERAGAYGEFTVLVDGRPVSRGMPLATMFGVIPKAEDILDDVRETLERRGSGL